MQVVYLKNSDGHKRGDVKEVAEGFARNFLLPQQVAILATPDNIKKIKSELGKQDKQKKEVVSGAQKLADKIRYKKIEIKGKANAAGKLYAAISETEIKNELKRLGYNIGTAKIVSSSHLKEAGEYEVKVDFGHSINSNIKVVVKV